MLRKAGNILRRIKFRIKYNGTPVKWEGSGFLNCEYDLDLCAVVDINKEVYFRKNCAVRVRDNAILKIGRNVSFNNGCILTSRESITIGNNVLFGPNVLVFDHDHDFRGDDFMHKFKTKPIIIEDNVWIGGNVSILKGAIIHTGAVIGAGAVVCGEIPENSVYTNKSKGNICQYKQ